MNNDHIFNVYPEIVGQFSDRDAAQIHECLRLGEQNGAAGDFPLADMGIKQGLTDGYVCCSCQLIQNQETRVVPVQPIPYPRISQSYDKFHTKTSRTAVSAELQRTRTVPTIRAHGQRFAFPPSAVPPSPSAGCSGFLRRCFRLRHGDLHNGDHGHADVARVEDRNAFRNRDVLNLDRIADIQAADIEIDEIGQDPRADRRPSDPA